MKKLILAVALVMVAGASVNAQSIKFGSVKSDEIIMAMPETDSARVKIEQRSATYQKDYELLNADFAAKYDTYNKNVSTYSAIMRQQKEKELQELRNRINEFEQSVSQDLQEFQNISMKPVYDKVNAAIEKIAKANAITFVINATQPPFLYMNNAVVTDITPLVKTELKIK